MITAKEMEKFAALRRKVFDFIEEEDKEYEFTVGNEGQMSIVFPSLPDEKDQNGEARWAILLDCYDLGSMRHFTWPGQTLMDAIDNATVQFDMMVKERNAA